MSQFDMSSLLANPLTWVIVIGAYVCVAVAVAMIRRARDKATAT